MECLAALREWTGHSQESFACCLLEDSLSVSIPWVTAICFKVDVIVCGMDGCSPIPEYRKMKPDVINLKLGHSVTSLEVTQKGSS